MAGRSVAAIPGHLCGRFALLRTGRSLDRVWRHRAMLRSAAGKRRALDERGDTALAAQSLLDAPGAELFDVDVRPISLDVSRSLFTSGDARPLSGRHNLLSPRNSADRRDCAATSPETRTNAN